jgi:hypothetical protein
MSAELSDKRIIACNLLETVSTASVGALCYVRATTGTEARVELLIRSRSGRWISKWESLKRVGNFRFNTLAPDHPRYDDERLMAYASEDSLAWLQRLTQPEG